MLPHATRVDIALTATHSQQQRAKTLYQVTKQMYRVTERLYHDAIRLYPDTVQTYRALVQWLRPRCGLYASWCVVMVLLGRTLWAQQGLRLQMLRPFSRGFEPVVTTLERFATLC